MKKICSIVLLVILLGGCTLEQGKPQSKESSKTEQNIVPNNKEIFNKKKECSNFSGDIDKDLEKEYGHIFNSDFHVEQIFYSPSKNSCLYAFYTTQQYIDPKSNFEDQWRWYVINDFLTKETVWTSKIIKMNLDGLTYHDQKEQEFQSKIEELKK